MEDNIQSVYNKLVSFGYKGTEDDFRNYISDDANIPSVYDKFVSNGYKGTEDDFRGYIGMPRQQQPAPRVDVSDVEAQQQTQVPTVTMEQVDNEPKQPYGDLTAENFVTMQQRGKELADQRKRIQQELDNDTEMEPLTVTKRKEYESQLRGLDEELRGVSSWMDEWNKTEGARAYYDQQKRAVDDVSARIDQMQADRNRERINKNVEEDNKKSWWRRMAEGLASAENPITAEVVEAVTDTDNNDLRAARNEVRNAKNQLRLEEMRQNGEQRGLGFLRGMENANYYELMPAVGMADAMSILQLSQDIKDGKELTDSQKLLKEAMEARAGVDFAYEDNNNLWERIGQSAPEQLMFTAQFVVGAGLTGATKVGEKVAAKSAERAVKRLAKKEATSAARNFVGTRVVPELEGMAVSSAIQTFSNPLSVAGMVEDFEKRYAGDIYYDKQGNLHVFDNDRSAGQAAYQAIASAWIENFTEYAGGNITKSAKLLDSKMFDLAGKFDNVMKTVGAGKIQDVFRIPQQLGRLTQIGSAPEEFLEEELGSVMNALMGTDAQRGESYGDAFKNTISSSFAGEQQLETFLSCAITSMLLGGGGNAVNGVRNAGLRKSVNQDVEQSKALLGKVRGVDIEGLDNMIENGRVNDISVYLKEQSDANNWNKDEQGAAVSYVLNRSRQIGVKHNDDTAIEAEQAEYRRQAEQMVNRWDGQNIYNVTYTDRNGETQEGTIVNGRVHYNTNEDGSYTFDPYMSSGMLAIRRADGSVEQVAGRNVTALNNVMSLEEQLESQNQTIDQMLRGQFEQDGMLPTIESVWGGNLVPNVTQFQNGRYTYLEQDDNGLYAFANNDKKTSKDNPIVYLTERQLVEYGLSLNLENAQANGDTEAAQKAQEDIDFLKRLDEITADAGAKGQWDVLKAYAQRKVLFDNNNEIIPDGSNEQATAAYLLAISEGSFENAIASVDQTIAALGTPQQTEVTDNAADNAAMNNAAATVDADKARQIDFYTNVRNRLTEMQQGKEEADQEEAEQVVANTPVSQMEVGQQFPVEWKGQQAMATVMGKDADGRSVVTVRDMDGEDIEAGIDDMSDAQWEAVRVQPQEATAPEQVPPQAAPQAPEQVEPQQEVPQAEQQQEETPQPQEPQLPRDKDGNIDYEQISDPVMYAQGLHEEFGDEAIDTINELIAEENENYAKATEKKNAIERRRAQKESQGKLDFYYKVKDALTPQEQVETPTEEAAPVEEAPIEQPVAEAPVEEAQPEQAPEQEATEESEPIAEETVEEQPSKPTEKEDSEFQKRIAAVGEPRNLEEAILMDIALGGAKFRWGNRNEDKKVLKRGIGDLWKYDNKEFRKRIGIVKKDGFSIETYAEAILAGQLQPYSGAVSQQAEGMDFQDIVAAIEDVLQMVTSKTGALQALEENRQAEAEEEQRYIRSLQDKEARDMGFEDWEDYENYQKSLEENNLTDDDYEEINRIFAEQTQEEDEQRARTSESEGDTAANQSDEQQGVRGESEGGTGVLQGTQVTDTGATEPTGQSTRSESGDTTNAAPQGEGADEVRAEIDRLKAKRANIVAQRNDIQQRYEQANGLFGDTQADESNLFPDQNFLSPELAQATIDGYNRQIKQIDEQIAKLEASLKSAEGVTQTEIEEAAEVAPANGGNTIFTEDEKDRRIEALKRRHRSQLNIAINPKDMEDLLYMAGYHIERGVRKFADFCKNMIEDLGDWVRPYLQTVYLGAKGDEDIKKLGIDRKEWSGEDEVLDFDVENFDKDKEEMPKQEGTNWKEKALAIPGITFFEEREDGLEIGTNRSTTLYRFDDYDRSQEQLQQDKEVLAKWEKDHDDNVLLSKVKSSGDQYATEYAKRHDMDFAAQLRYDWSSAKTYAKDALKGEALYRDVLIPYMEQREKSKKDKTDNGVHQYTEKQKKAFSEAVTVDMRLALERGEKTYKSINDIRRRAESVGMEVDKEGRDDILLQELVEDGLVRAARQVIKSGRFGGAKSKEAFDAICKLYEMQPTISMRSSNRVKMQQYSTPLPMAFVADMFAYKGGKVLEPTAGNGMLVFAIPSKNVTVNELDETRLANLREQGFPMVLNEDALTVRFVGKYDSVIANPPFGSSPAKDYDGKMIAGLDEQITLNALSAMKDDGRAAIIIGGNMEYGKNGGVAGNRAFWTYLYDHYNVKGVVDMEGKLYGRQGTTYPTRMILIDGRRSEEERAQTAVYPPVKEKAVRKAESFDDLYDIVTELLSLPNKTNGNEVLRDKPPVSDNNGTQGQTGVQRRGEESDENDSDVGGRDGRGNGVEGTRPNAQGEVRPTKGDSGSVDVGSRPSGLHGAQSHQDGTEREPVVPDSGTAERPGRGANDRGSTESKPNGEPGRVSDGGVQDVGTPVQRVGLTQPKEQEKRTLTEEKLPYRQHNSAFSLESVAPAAMVEAMDKALAEIEKTYGKSIDEFVTEELGYDSVEDMHNALAAEQVDSVAMAIHQMKQGQAMIIGDQTGVGKGRQMAALIRWAHRQGKKPIFITKDANLFSDIYRDLVDVGSGDLKPFIFNKYVGKGKGKDTSGEMVDADGNLVHKGATDGLWKKVLEEGKLPDEYDFAVLTYSQVNTGDQQSREEARKEAKENGTRSGSKKKDDAAKISPKAPFLRALAKDNYLLLDESHTAAGESNIGAFLQSILREAKAVTFASATFAKRPDTMPLYAIRTAMSKANVKANELINIIKKGGVTLQEIMSRALTEAGQMVRRERNMNGVKTDWETISDPKLVKSSRESYDRTIAAFNAIIKFQEDYIKPMIAALSGQLAFTAGSADVKRGTDKAGVDNTPFASKTYNYTKQLMLALKVDAVVDKVVSEIDAGRHPVIALESTMESFLDDYAIGDVINEPTLSLSLLKGLDSVMQYTIKDENGEESHQRYTPEDLGEEGERAYYELQDFIRESTKGIFISPLDAIISKLNEKGYKVGELTGRSTYLEYNDKGQAVVKSREDKDKKRMMREFNSGALDVLILNKSASTGISLHASKKFSDQRQRTMVIAQPLSDINDYMQMIGRIDRTGQVHRGYYINLGLPVPAENRFLMMFSTKLKSLNANTTTSQESESNSVEAPDLLNKYGSRVVVEYLRDNPEIYMKIGEPLKNANGTIKANDLDDYQAPENDDVVRKITGRVALLTTKEQDDFYNDVVRRYTDLIKYLDDTGTNDLKITVMPLKAKTLEKKVSSEGVDPNGSNPFAKDAYVETVEMDVLRKPMKADDVRKTIEQLNTPKGTEHGHLATAAKEKSVGDRVMEIIGTVQREAQEKLQAENERYEEAKKKAVEDIEKQRAKINKQQKRTEEEKAEAIEKFITDTNTKVEEQHQRNVMKIEALSELLEEKLTWFKVGGSYLMPDVLESESLASPELASPAIFCGYKAKDSKITSSTTFAVFATLDGRRRIEVKLSDNAAAAIGRLTSDNYDIAQEVTLDNWDSKIPTNTRKTSYIMTGNILQAVKDTQDPNGNYPGQLVSYTDEEGNVHDGILMPDKWKPGMMKSSGKPINFPPVVNKILNGELVKSTDGKVSIYGSGWAKTYTLTVPKTKKEGGVYFENPVILKSVSSRGFWQNRGEFRADINGEDNMRAVVNELANLGVRVSDEQQGDGEVMYRDQEREYKAGEMLPITRSENGYRVEGLNDSFPNVDRLLDAWRDSHPDYFAEVRDGQLYVEPWNLGEGSTAKERRRNQATAERQWRRAHERANDTIEKLGLQDRVTILDSTDGLTGKRKTAKGWFDPKTGKIVIVMPNHNSPRDVVKTILHEGVAHYGLRKLVGNENMNDFLDKVFENASEEVRSRIIDLAMDKYNRNFRTATEEYLAGLAEDTNFEDAKDKDWFKKIKGWFIRMLHKVGISLENAEDFVDTINDAPQGNPDGLTDNELRYLLWKSYRNLVADAESLTEFARDAAMQSALEVGNFAPAVAAESMAREENDYSSMSNEDLFVNLLTDKKEIDNGILEEIIRRVENDMARVSRIPKSESGREDETPSIVAQAIARGVRANGNGEVWERGQARKAIKQWAKDNGYWYDEIRLHEGTNEREGGAESRVFVAYDYSFVRKLTQPVFYNDSQPVLESLEMFGDVFRDTAYTIKGFGENEFGQLCIVTEQPFITGDTLNETGLGMDWIYDTLGDYMESMGFERVGRTSFKNDKYTVYDINANNVIIDENGDLFVIDAGVKLTKNDDYDNDDILFRDAEPANRIADDYNRETAARVDGVSGVKRGWEQFVRGMMDDMRPLEQMQQVIAKTLGRELRDSEKAYELQTQLTSKAGRQLEREHLDYMVPVLQQVATIIKSIKDIDDYSTDEAYKMVTNYLLAKHGLERNEWFVKQGKKEKDRAGLRGLAESLGENPKDYKAVAERVVSEFENRVDTKDLWKSMKALTDRMLEISYETGMIDKETFDDLKQRHKYYVPLRGFADGTAADMFDYVTQSPHFQNIFQKASGRQSMADDPLANLMSMLHSAIVIGNQNEVMQKIHNLAVNSNSDLLRITKPWYVYNDTTDTWEEKFPDIPEGATADEIDTIVKQFEADMVQLKANGKAKRKLNRIDVGKKLLRRQAKEHEMVAYIDGKPVRMYVAGNPLVAQAMNKVNTQHLNKVMQVIQKITRWYSAINTSWSPAFGPRNARKDLRMMLFGAYTTGGLRKVGRSAKWIAKAGWALPRLLITGKMDKGLVKAVGPQKAAQLEQWWNEFLDNGGETGFTRTLNAEKAKGDVKDMVRHMLNGSKDGENRVRKYTIGLLEWIGRYSEDISRFAAYCEYREQGGSVLGSINEAKNVTVNFNVHGGSDLAANCRALYSFFNASMQGINRMRRLATEHPKRFAAGISALLLGGAVLPWLNIWLFGLLGGDDDDWRKYEELTEYTANHNMILFVGNHKFISTPWSQELAPFNALGNIWFRQQMGWNKGRSVAEQWGDMLVDLSPISVTSGKKPGVGLVKTIMPSFTTPVWEAIFNEDFTGSPLYKDNQWNKYDASWEKAYTGKTSQSVIDASKWLNEKTGIDINPAIAEHLFSGVLGGIGRSGDKLLRYVTNGFQLQDAPFIRTMMFDSNPKGYMGAVQREYGRNAYEVLPKIKHDVDDMDAMEFARFSQTEEFEIANMVSIYKTGKDLAGNKKGIVGIDTMEKEYKKMAGMSDGSEAYREQLEAVKADITELKMEMLDEIQQIKYEHSGELRKRIMDRVNEVEQKSKEKYKRRNGEEE